MINSFARLTPAVKTLCLGSITESVRPLAADCQVKGVLERGGLLIVVVQDKKEEI